MRHLAFLFSFILLLPAVSYAADDLDQLLQSYSVVTKTPWWGYCNSGQRHSSFAQR